MKFFSVLVIERVAVQVIGGAPLRVIILGGVDVVHDFNRSVAVAVSHASGSKATHKAVAEDKEEQAKCGNTGPDTE
jgi:hypothetical protein